MHFPIAILGLIEPTRSILAASTEVVERALQRRENLENHLAMNKENNPLGRPMERFIDKQIISGLSTLHESIIRNVIENLERENKISASKENEEIIHFLKIGVDLLELKRKNLHK